ncbi:Predicted transporter (major facilitator superfamily) [Phaffia rhodozyma]|uniref:Predicted transporter (Major facilitator superfamily) n=1 Tax=Phaffia rhodozyma TaxID=264483 RepID=A0A0F7SMA6_PHARH|nr:Predicted transporter (major facilitator superfamily) [Phaffia rhodozyma]
MSDTHTDYEANKRIVSEEAGQQYAAYTLEKHDVHDTEMQPGVAKVEAAQAVWTPLSKWALLISIGLASYVYSLDGVTTYLFLYQATSTVLDHSLSGTVTTAAAIIIAVGKPAFAKFADVFGRGETYIISVVAYIVGYAVIASASTINQVAGGDVIYSFGYTGLQILTQIILADITTLRWRAFASGLCTMPFVINAFVGSNIAAAINPNWRWGYGIFCIIIPVCVLPIIITLLWAQRKAKKAALLRVPTLATAALSPPEYIAASVPVHTTATGDDGVDAGLNVVPQIYQTGFKNFGATLKGLFIEMDIIGLILIAATLALVLLPLGLAPKALRGWKTPSMIVMIVLGVCLIPVTVIYEVKIAKKPVAPYRFFKNRNISAACAIGFLDFVSFYLSYTYLYSFVYVSQPTWSPVNLNYFAYTQSIALCVFGFLAGILMVFTRNLKWTLFGGLLIRLLGVGIMIHSRGGNGSAAELVMTQVLQGMGGGFAAICLQVAAQARVPHVDVATVTALVLLITEVGNSVGSAVATAVWTSQMPAALAKYVPGNNATLNAELYASITIIAAYPAADPIRVGAIHAYDYVMRNLCIGATVVAVFPPIIAFFFVDDVRLGDVQNVYDGRDLSGRLTGEIDESSPNHPNNIKN